MLSRQDQPNPSAPAVQKLRMRYAKRGRLRFTSHRDVARAFERALRRAGVPMAYSQGFSPHPKVSWVGAAPTGVASEAEYMEIQVAERVEPETLRRALDVALPPGLDVLEIVLAGPGSLAERIDASMWSIIVPGVTAEALRDAVDRLLAAERVEVERLTKDGMRTVDARAAVVTAEVCTSAEAAGETAPESSLRVAEVSGLPEPYGILRLVVRQTTPAIRPDDVLSALRIVAALMPLVPAKATRMAQGWLDDSGGLADPFAPDRVAALQVSGLPVGEQGAG